MSPLSRCSIQKECALGQLARSWISMGEGPQQCPSMTLTPPEISVSADIKVKSASLYVPITPRVKRKHLFYVVSCILLVFTMGNIIFETLQKSFDTSFAEVQVTLNQLLQFWLMSQMQRSSEDVHMSKYLCLLSIC